MCCLHKSSCCIHLSQLAWWNRLKAASAGGNQIPWWFTVDKIWPQIYPPKRSTKKCRAQHWATRSEAWLDQDFCACKVAAATICQEDLRGSFPLTSLLEDHMEFREAKSYPKGWIIQHSLHQRGQVKIIVSNNHIATPSGPSLPFFFWMFEIFLKFILHTTSVEMCQSLCTSCGKYLYSISWYSSPANSLASGSQVHQTKRASKTWPAC